MLAAGLIAGIVASVLFNLGIALQATQARRIPGLLPTVGAAQIR